MFPCSDEILLDFENFPDNGIVMGEENDNAKESRIVLQSKKS